MITFSQSKTQGVANIYGPKEATVFVALNFINFDNGRSSGFVRIKSSIYTFLSYAGSASVTGVSFSNIERIK